MDETEEIFRLYGVPYQPVTVLIAGDQTVVEAWDGLRPEEDMRAALDTLISLSG
ncbi:MAG: peroxiredoxin family protein [Acidimicrobiia bacterium]